MGKWCRKLALLMLLSYFPLVFADCNPLLNFVQQSTLNGNLRLYYFTRDYTNPLTSDQSAFSLGGNLNFLSAQFLGGFQIGSTLYTAQPMGLNSQYTFKIDRSLPGKPITTLGQKFLQFNRDNFLFRGGDQLITTPWLNPSDSRMIPATYRGLYSTYSPFDGLSFTALRIWEYKSRVQASFSQTNLYNPLNLGLPPIPALGGWKNNGTLAGAATYKVSDWTTQVWGYQFYDFARLIYGETSYITQESIPVKPLVALQVFREWGDGNNILQQVSTGRADSRGYGLKTGFIIRNFSINTAFDIIPEHNGAFNNGDVVSPYTSGYTSDPLYTTSMAVGLVERAAGESFKVTGGYLGFDKQLNILLSYAKYFTKPYLPNVDETDFDTTYTFPTKTVLHGFSIRDRLGIQKGIPQFRVFYYNRVMLQYNF